MKTLSIRNTDHQKLLLTATRLILPGSCHDAVMRLRDLRPRVTVVPGFRLTRPFCLFHPAGSKGKRLVSSDSFSVSFAERTIGCCRFGKPTWALITEAAMKTRKRTKK